MSRRRSFAAPPSFAVGAALVRAGFVGAVLGTVLVACSPGGGAGDAGGGAARSAVTAAPVPGTSAAASPTRQPAGWPSPVATPAERRTVPPQPEPRTEPPPRGAATAATVVDSLRRAGLPAAGPRTDDCRALPPGMADGCAEIVRTETITVWRFTNAAAARRYVTAVLGAGGGAVAGAYVVEYGTGTPATLRDDYARVLERYGR